MHISSTLPMRRSLRLAVCSAPWQPNPHSPRSAHLKEPLVSRTPEPRGPSRFWPLNSRLAKLLRHIRAESPPVSSRPAPDAWEQATNSCCERVSSHGEPLWASLQAEEGLVPKLQLPVAGKEPLQPLQ